MGGATEEWGWEGMEGMEGWVWEWEWEVCMDGGCMGEAWG